MLGQIVSYFFQDLWIVEEQRVSREHNSVEDSHFFLGWTIILTNPTPSLFNFEVGESPIKTAFSPVLHCCPPNWAHHNPCWVGCERYTVGETGSFFLRKWLSLKGPGVADTEAAPIRNPSLLSAFGRFVWGHFCAATVNVVGGVFRGQVLHFTE